MIETKIYNPPISIFTRNLSDGLQELSRLLAAAVINPDFCRLLLDEPDLALQRGFQGEDFYFPDDERNLILAIRAESLSSLASQLALTFNEHLHLHLNPSVQPMAVFGY